MTVHIGSMGVERPRVDAAFDWFGKTIRVHPDISDLAMVEFLDMASGIEVDPVTGMPSAGVDEVRATTVVASMLKDQIHPDDYDLFFSTAKAHRQTLTDLMVLSQRLIATVSAFPTGQPSDSSSGQSDGTETLPVALSNRAGRRSSEGKELVKKAMSARELSDMVRAADMTADRPDIQVVVQQRYAATSGASV